MNYARSTTLSSRAGQPIAARAFTLIEMVVVLGIIGILAALTLPSFTKAGKGNITEAATRQLMDDLAYARLKAMSQRTKVYVVFAPDYYWLTNIPPINVSYLDSPAATNFFFFNQPANVIIGSQLSGYAVYSPRMVGEQPGQKTARYISEWHSLPAGALFPVAAFRNAGIFHNLTSSPRFDDILLEDGSTNAFRLPFIGFDETGRLFGRTTNIAIPIVEGAVLHPKDDITGQTNLVKDSGIDAVETAPPVPQNGGIVAGVNYLVTGALSMGARVIYPPSGPTSRIYNAGTTFLGTNTSANFTPQFGARVVPFHGVSIDWVTGRARTVKPELP